MVRPSPTAKATSCAIKKAHARNRGFRAVGVCVVNTPGLLRSDTEVASEALWRAVRRGGSGRRFCLPFLNCLSIFAGSGTRGQGRLDYGNRGAGRVLPVAAFAFQGL